MTLLLAHNYLIEDEKWKSQWIKKKIPLNLHQCWNRLNPRQIKMSVDLPREDSQHQVQDKKGADDD